MKALEYPFDESYILTKKKSIKRELLAGKKSEEWLRKRIAILGGSTTSNIKLILELFLLNNGIYPEFYESEYNMYYEDAMFDNPVLKEFAPDIIYICTTNRNITDYPTVSDTTDTVNYKLDKELSKFTDMWTMLNEVYKCPILQNNFEMPFYRLMGNKEASDIHGRINFITRLNLKFYEYAQMHDNFYICDINYISADYGLKEWSDPFYWYMYKYAMNVLAIPHLSFNVANIIKSVFGKNKKGFVLDLDNTLWGGVVGDDGADKLEIGNETAAGEAYLEFQEYIKAHKELGVILNVNSKNDRENAIAGLNHTEGVLKPDDFIVIKANWNPKNQNYTEIAKELNLLPESLVFVDDNPVERDIVTSQLPGVAAPDIKEVHKYIQMIDRSGFFEVTSLSADDKLRNEMYRSNAKRIEAEAAYSNYTDYLLSLEMRAVIKAFEPVYMSRIAQLTNKSNQFNLTTKRYTQSEIETVAASGDYITLYGKLEDKFGDNGVVAVTVGHVTMDVCHIDLWLMSCRVLKRNMEYAMMDELVKECSLRGIKAIKGYYYPTAKNSMVKDFYAEQGFAKLSENEQGNSEWLLEIDCDYIAKNEVIKIVTEM